MAACAPIMNLDTVPQIASNSTNLWERTKVFYESILSIHEFAPKKKYVEELKDTDRLMLYSTQFRQLNQIK